MAPPYALIFTNEARDQLEDLKRDGSQAKRLKKVRKALGRIQLDPRYPGLRTHKYSSIKGQSGQEVFDSYVENHTPSAWRIFWHYGPAEEAITIILITPHP